MWCSALEVSAACVSTQDPLPPRGLRLEVVGDSIAAGAAAEAPARSGAHGNESNEDALGPLGSSR